ncbi:hypothetical protein MMUR_28830 [Mycolicibacterium murale]|uniref:VOC domain-containing protein n=1 Tax=Mycolicibacterium murale TaxID=182220 RepID=A0A7I9WNF6_9MYCO|nr:VOC family protein [Mycolicibacterium murale]MCV7180332.1 VOC family protein [Mycolicibacterium murale]GFG58747.1 hypothetical protein MMUR_28830 [Mycolicibacterium murale]
MTNTGWSLDHCSLTVPDLEAAVDFFTVVVGARTQYSRTLDPGSAPAAMRENFNAHPDVGFRLAKLEIPGGLGLELFEYQAPDQTREHPRNCDVGGTHLGFLVDDLNAAIARVRKYPGTRVLGHPQSLPPGHPLAGRTWIYFLSPWGQQLELVDDSGRQ